MRRSVPSGLAEGRTVILPLHPILVYMEQPYRSRGITVQNGRPALGWTRPGAKFARPENFSSFSSSRMRDHCARETIMARVTTARLWRASPTLDASHHENGVSFPNLVF